MSACRSFQPPGGTGANILGWAPVIKIHPLEKQDYLSKFFFMAVHQILISKGWGVDWPTSQPRLN